MDLFSPRSRSGNRPENDENRETEDDHPQPPRVDTGTDPNRSEAIQELLTLLLENSNKRDQSEKVSDPEPICGAFLRPETKTEPYVGGEPLSGFSGIKGGPTYHSPAQVRHLGAAGQKSEHLRAKGLSTKFKEGDDLRLFLTKLYDCWSHNGMDTCAHVEVGGIMYSILKHYTRLSFDEVFSAEKEQVRLYDIYLASDSQTAIKMFRNSVDEKIIRSLDTVWPKDAPKTLCAYIMKFVELQRNLDQDSIDATLAEFKAIRPNQFAGFNVSKFCEKGLTLATELENVDSLQANHVLHFLTVLCTATPKENFDYHFPLQVKREELLKVMNEVRFLSPNEQMRALEIKNLSIRDIAEKATHIYTKQAKARPPTWPGLAHTKDSGAAPSAFHAETSSVSPNHVPRSSPPTTKHQTYLSAALSGTQTGSTCHNCGKPGHWQRNCPQKQDKNRASSTRRSTPPHHKSNKKTHKNSPRNTHTSESGWKTTPIEGKTKIVRDGLVWGWCSICKKWTTTHNTDGTDGMPKHRGPNPNSSPAHDSPATQSRAYAHLAGLSLDTGAFLAALPANTPRRPSASNLRGSPRHLRTTTAPTAAPAPAPAPAPHSDPSQNACTTLGSPTIPLQTLLRDHLRPVLALPLPSGSLLLSGTAIGLLLGNSPTAHAPLNLLLSSLSDVPPHLWELTAAGSVGAALHWLVTKWLRSDASPLPSTDPTATPPSPPHHSPSAFRPCTAPLAPHTLNAISWGQTPLRSAAHAALRKIPRPLPPASPRSPTPAFGKSTAKHLRHLVAHARPRFDTPQRPPTSSTPSREGENNNINLPWASHASTPVSSNKTRSTFSDITSSPGLSTTSHSNETSVATFGSVRQHMRPSARTSPTKNNKTKKKKSGAEIVMDPTARRSVTSHNETSGLSCESASNAHRAPHGNTTRDTTGEQDDATTELERKNYEAVSIARLGADMGAKVLRNVVKGQAAKWFVGQNKKDKLIDYPFPFTIWDIRLWQKQNNLLSMNVAASRVIRLTPVELRSKEIVVLCVFWNHMNDYSYPTVCLPSEIVMAVFEWYCISLYGATFETVRETMDRHWYSPMYNEWKGSMQLLHRQIRNRGNGASYRWKRYTPDQLFDKVESEVFLRGKHARKSGWYKYPSSTTLNDRYLIGIQYSHVWQLIPIDSEVPCLYSGRSNNLYLKKFAPIVCSSLIPNNPRVEQTTSHANYALLSYEQLLDESHAGLFLSAHWNGNFLVVWDTGASHSITNDPSDFVWMTEVDEETSVQGVGNSVKIKGFGLILWRVYSDNGNIITIKVFGYYVPDTPVRLLRVQDSTKGLPGRRIIIPTEEDLPFFPNLPSNGGMIYSVNGDTVTIPYHAKSNLPISTMFTSTSSSELNLVSEGDIESAFTAVIHERNLNLTASEREMLMWHQKLGHVNFRSVQFLLSTGTLASTPTSRQLHASVCKLRHGVMCTACQYGKQKRRPKPGKQQTAIRDQEMSLKRDVLRPGERVFVDHYQANPRGRRFETYGKEPEHQRYYGGALFVDGASGYIHNYFITTPNTHETLAAKEDFENFCRDSGVIPSTYHADQDTSFTSYEFAQNLRNFKQIMNFAGTGAHHTNAPAERAIQTICCSARTMLLHFAVHWPEVFSQALWPMAIAHATWIYNHLPNPSTGHSPVDIFTATRWDKSRLRHLHVFGAPAYVLQPKLMDGQRIPRWKPRSERYIYVGQSEKHPQSVALVLSPDTGKISAQYHVVIDDRFQTVSSTVDDLPDPLSEEWQTIFGHTDLQFTPPDDMELEDPLLGDSPPPSLAQAHRHSQVAAPFHPPPTPVAPPPPTAPLDPSPPSRSYSSDSSSSSLFNSLDVPSNTYSPPSLSSSSSPSVESTRAPSVASPRAPPTPPPLPQRANVTPTVSSSPLQTIVEEPTSVPTPMEEESPFFAANKEQETPIFEEAQHVPKTSHNDPSPTTTRRNSTSGSTEPTLRRSSRSTKGKAAIKLSPNDPSTYLAQMDVDIDSFALDPSASPNLPKTVAAFLAQDIWSEIESEFYCLKASKTDRDIYNFDQAMNGPDRDKWIKAAEIEIDGLVEHGSFIEVPIEEANGTHIDQGMWIFKVKRAPDGSVLKYKARWVIRGDLQEDNGEDNYAPVCKFTSVRILIVLAIVKGWVTAAIDFSQAFIHGILEKPFYVHLPRGFKANKPGRHVVKMLRSAYGRTDAPKIWFKCLHEALIKLGFVQSTNDPCLFFREDIILCVYVDDLAIAAKNHEVIKTMVKDFEKLGFSLTYESTLEAFLGIHIEKKGNTYHLSQPGMIDKIVKTLQLEDSSPNHLPAPIDGLGLDPDGPPMNEKWDYRSVVGMLLYVSTHTRMDIVMAVSQLARFSNEPKASHAKAAKQLGRYLKGTRDKGVYMTPSLETCFDLLADSDFCGLHHQEPPWSETVARSRTGYLVEWCGCPIIAKSYLQTSTALSTLEAECNAAVDALRACIPIRELLLEIHHHVPIYTDQRLQNFPIIMHQDNQGVYMVANSGRGTDRTKYFISKFRWLWEQKSALPLSIVKVDTTDMLADYLTKQLPRQVFERIRYFVQGW